MSGLRHFLDLDRLDSATLRGILDRGLACKRDGAAAAGARPLAGKALAMIFEKPSTRTRVSFERGIQQLGGEAIVLEPSGSQLGRGPSSLVAHDTPGRGWSRAVGRVDHGDQHGQACLDDFPTITNVASYLNHVVGQVTLDALRKIQ